MRFRFKPTLTWSLLLLLGAAMFIPVPYVMKSPGPVFNTIGEIRDVELISISGTQTYPTEGELNMTTVSEYGGPQQGLDMFQAIWGWLSPDRTVVPRESVYPEGETTEQSMKMGAQEMADSQLNATAAALKYLGYELSSKLIIGQINEQSNAFNVLKIEDELLTVDNLKYESQSELASERIQICNECEFKNTIPIIHCGECGCALKAKIFSPVKGACPKSKWDEVDNKFLP